MILNSYSVEKICKSFYCFEGFKIAQKLSLVLIAVSCIWFMTDIMQKLLILSLFWRKRV